MQTASNKEVLSDEQATWTDMRTIVCSVFVAVLVACINAKPLISRHAGKLPEESMNVVRVLSGNCSLNACRILDAAYSVPRISIGA